MYRILMETPDMRRWLPWTDRVQGLYDMTERFLWQQHNAEQGTACHFVICTDEQTGIGGELNIYDIDGQYAGVGYYLRQHLQGRGITTRALRAASSWILDQAQVVEGLFLTADEQNIASNKVAQGADFTFVEGGVTIPQHSGSMNLYVRGRAAVGARV
jgi:ribosomal-protein-serine acetyltransferase